MGWNASRAVDGNPDQDGTYGSCAWAHNNDDVFKTWWNVDLGSVYDVQSIEVFFRTDGETFSTHKMTSKGNAGCSWSSNFIKNH